MFCFLKKNLPPSLLLSSLLLFFDVDVFAFEVDRGSLYSHQDRDPFSDRQGFSSEKDFPFAQGGEI